MQHVEGGFFAYAGSMMERSFQRWFLIHLSTFFNLKPWYVVSASYSGYVLPCRGLLASRRLDMAEIRTFRLHRCNFDLGHINEGERTVLFAFAQSVWAELLSVAWVMSRVPRMLGHRVCHNVSIWPLNSGTMLRRRGLRGSSFGGVVAGVNWAVD